MASTPNVNLFRVTRKRSRGLHPLVPVQSYTGEMINKEKVTDSMLSDDYLKKTLQLRTSTEVRTQVQGCVLTAIKDLDPVEMIKVTADLIAYFRDEALPALGTVRRTAALAARDQFGMSASEIAMATGTTMATVRRLITEHRQNL